MEKWKDIIGYNGRYQVSNLGKIKSLIRNKIMVQANHPKGYKTISLWINGKIKTHTVHVLVAVHFVDNPLGKPQVNHIDGIKSNNFDFNLEWSTNGENQTHAYAIGLQTGSLGKTWVCKK